MVVPVTDGASETVKNFKEKFVSHTRKTFNKFTTQDSNT